MNTYYVHYIDNRTLLNGTLLMLGGTFISGVMIICIVCISYIED